MKRLGKFVALSATGVVVLSLMGCDLQVAGDDLATVIGEHAHAVKIDPDSLAKNWRGVSADGIKNAAGKLHDSDVWEGINEQLGHLNESTEGPARDLTIETACDAVEQNDYSESYIEGDLKDNLLHQIYPYSKQLLDTVEDLTGTLQRDYDNGDSATKAEIAIGCAANSVHGEFNS
jgi:hypothetical protein